VSSRRTAILIGAIAIGIVAVLLIVQYVNGIEDKIKGDNVETSVFVAKNDIKRGTDGATAVADSSIASASIPRQFAPATRIESTDAVQKKVALFDIASGTVIVNGMFVDPSTTTITFRQRLSSPKHVAISISTDPVHGVGGFLVPGDEVNMMIYQDNAKIKAALESPPKGADASGGDEQTNPDISGGADLLDAIDAKPPENYVTTGGPQWIVLNRTARYMYQKVKIIAVGSNQLLTPGEQAATPGANGAAPTTASNILTLEVPPDAAQYVAAGQDASFYLTLVAKDYKPQANLHPLPIVMDTLPGEDPGKLCPYWDTTSGPEDTREKGCSG
jgi:Flp pilus assembly protein CpaB